ncbi:MAG: hypothetical protein ACJA1E_001780 [Paracoccaceae bacterium]|jgi:hypothetical protein
MSEEKHVHGSMNIDVQEKTFATFAKISTYSIVGIICFLIFLYIVNG